MPPLGPIKRRQLIRNLKKLGFEGPALSFAIITLWGTQDFPYLRWRMTSKASTAAAEVAPSDC
jgi:hypothetical protein